MVAAGSEQFRQWTPYVWSVFGLLRLSPIRVLGHTWMHEGEPHRKRGIELVCIYNSCVCPASCCCCLQELSSVRHCCSTLTLVNLLLSASYFISILLIMDVHHCRLHSWALQTKPRFEPHTAWLFASLHWQLRNRAFFIQWYVASGKLVYQTEHSREQDEVSCPWMHTGCGHKTHRMKSGSINYTITMISSMQWPANWWCHQLSMVNTL